MAPLYRVATFILLFFGLLAVSEASAKDPSELVGLLNGGGHIALMRHALAPETLLERDQISGTDNWG